MNTKLIKQLEILASYYKKHGQAFRSNAYYKAIRSLESYNKTIHSEKEALALDGIGKGIGKKIKEFFQTGKITEVEEAKKGALLSRKRREGKIAKHSNKDEVIAKFTNISWIGEGTANKLYNEGYRSLTELRKKPSSILTKNQRLMLKYHNKMKPLPRRFIKKFETSLHKLLDREFGKKSYQLLFTGSYRRGKSTSGDIDMVMRSSDFKLSDMIDILHQHKIIVEVLSKGSKDFKGIAIFNKVIFRLDIMFATKSTWATAILAYTGNAALNRAMRIKAMKQGMKLSQHGLFRSKKPLPLKTEKEIFKKLGVKYLPPNKRG